MQLGCRFLCRGRERQNVLSFDSDFLLEQRTGAPLMVEGDSQGASKGARSTLIGGDDHRRAPTNTMSGEGAICRGCGLSLYTYRARGCLSLFIKGVMPSYIYKKGWCASLYLIRGLLPLYIERHTPFRYKALVPLQQRSLVGGCGTLSPSPYI